IEIQRMGTYLQKCCQTYGLVRSTVELSVLHTSGIRSLQLPLIVSVTIEELQCLQVIGQHLETHIR
ncbi:hypothetical protein ACJMK2_021927, partial [Sinanodonta woodiana]